MDRLLSYIVRVVVWLSGFTKTLSRLGLCRYEEHAKGQPLKILLVGYNGARNTGADARVVALTQQLEQTLGTEEAVLTVMTLDTESVGGYFSKSVRLLHFTTVFIFSLLRACSTHHVAILCEGSTLTPTFADALCVFFCEASGIMRRQGKPCIAYGSEVGRLDGWLARLSSDLCRDTYFMVCTEESLYNLQAIGLKGHVGTDTPDILRASGINCQPRLFVDPVLCVAAPMAKAHQDRQLLMPFVSRREKYIISPYMDWLSFFFNRSWRKPMDGMVSLMIKLADVEEGDVHHNKMRKALTPLDHQRLQEGVKDCREILMRMGAKEHDIFLGTLNAGHPGGMLPLTQAEATTLHSPLLPDNLYVCDATILSQSLGLPPMITIMALAKRIARNIIAEKG